VNEHWGSNPKFVSQVQNFFLNLDLAHPQLFRLFKKDTIWKIYGCQK